MRMRCIVTIVVTEIVVVETSAALVDELIVTPGIDNERMLFGCMNDVLLLITFGTIQFEVMGRQRSQLPLHRRTPSTFQPAHLRSLAFSVVSRLGPYHYCLLLMISMIGTETLRRGEG